MPKRGSKSHYAVVIVKRTAGCTENQSQDTWPWVNRQHVLFSQRSENIECTKAN